MFNRPDVLIRGGLVADGSDKSARVADVAIEGDRIAAVGSLAAVEAATTIDASGCVVLPGFIDSHVHSEGVLLSKGSVDAALLQGVTTFVLGQDGTSIAPAARADRLAGIDQYWSALNGAIPRAVTAPLSVGDFLSLVDGGPVNVAYLIPNGNLRLNVVGWSARRAARAELAQMRELVAEGLAHGAVGLSSGLDYTPSKHADAAEIAELCTELAGAGVPYVTHMRGYRQRAAAGIAEAVEIARDAGVPLHVSHFSGTVDEVVPHLDRAEAAGVDISFDAYPFVASSTILAMAALPPELQTGSPNDTIDRLRSAAGRAALSDHITSANRDVGAMILAFVDAPSLKHLEGMLLADAARHEGLSVADLVVELLVQAEFRVAIIDQRLGAFSEADIREVACDRRHMVGSDGTYVGSHNHVRAYSTFAKFIDITVRASRRLEWHQATQHLSTRAARRFKLVGRGVIRAGAFADVAVLRPESLSYAEDVREPPRRAQGIDHLFVNGVHAVAGGELTGARGGRALRRDQRGPGEAVVEALR